MYAIYEELTQDITNYLVGLSLNGGQLLLFKSALTYNAETSFHDFWIYIPEGTNDRIYLGS